MHALFHLSLLVAVGAVLTSCGSSAEPPRLGGEVEDVALDVPVPGQRGSTTPGGVWSADSATLALADSLRTLPAIEQPSAPVGPGLREIMRGARELRAERVGPAEAETSPRCMPNAWRPDSARRGRPPLDLDSLSELPDSTRRRLIEADSVPTREPAPGRAGAAPMPAVPLDSVGLRMPVHALPECRAPRGR